MLQVARRRNQAGDLVPTQHHRQGAGHSHRIHLGHQLALIERDLEEELQPRDCSIERHRRGAEIDQVQLVTPQILDRGRVGRTAKKSSELPHHADITALRLVRELAHPHVIDHALPQRRDPVKR
jgi:hypothetical protein